MSNAGVYLINHNSGEKYLLDPQIPNTIGRGLDDENFVATITLPHAAISREHATVYLDPQTQRWIFHNLSSNGSLLNHELIEQDQQENLIHGDEITIGPFILSFYEKLRITEATQELPVIQHRRPPLPSPVEDEEESTRLGTIIEVVTILFFIGLSTFIFCCCFVF